MSKLIKWFWGKGSNKNSSPNQSPTEPNVTNMIANESDELEDESEEESKQNPNGPLDESLKIVEEIKKKREEEEKLKEEEAEDEGEEAEKVVVNETLASLSKDYHGYSISSAEEISEKVKKFSLLSNDEDIRDVSGHKWGGKICVDKNIVRKSRSIGKEIILEIGKRILSGKLNLTKITFPIKAMVPRTVLENVVHSSCVFPYFMNLAASTEDKIERMKFVITSTLSSFYWTASFMKPLNPILGETLQANYNDGTLVYAEQISHHPPISAYLIYGPKNNYIFSGYYCYEAKAGLNSVTIINKGKRCVKFADGQRINYNFPEEYYSGTLVGTLKQESLGKMVFSDLENKIHCEIIIGKMKKKPTDYFEGAIVQNSKIVSEINGTYMGYISFDNKRYWDYRYMIPNKINMEHSVKALPSDHLKRHDLLNLKKGDLNVAQVEKENLENIQRKDAKLRSDVVALSKKKK